MNKKRMLILLIVFVAVVGLSMSTVSAKTYTKTVKFKDYDTVNKYLGKGDYLGVSYISGYSKMSKKTNYFEISTWSSDYFSNYYKITKAKIKFTKKVNGKTKTYTKTYNADKKWGVINKHPPKGWKPYSAIVTYKDI